MSNMKRDGGFDQSGGGKKLRGGGYGGDQFEIRVLIPSKAAGSIIGKGGANVKKLRQDHSAQVRIPDSQGPERVVTVVAGDKETVINLLEEAIPMMYENETESVSYTHLTLPTKA